MHDSWFHKTRPSSVVRRYLYVPYVRELRAAERDIRAAIGRIYTGTARTFTDGEQARRRAAQVSSFHLARYQRFVIAAGPFAI
jgi:hypothetical protein